MYKSSSALRCSALSFNSHLRIYIRRTTSLEDQTSDLHSITQQQLPTTCEGFLDRSHPWSYDFIATLTINQLVRVHDELVDNIHFTRSSRYYNNPDMYETVQRIRNYGLHRSIVWHRMILNMIVTAPPIFYNPPSQPQVQLI
jgi:hypothetical protein